MNDGPDVTLAFCQAFRWKGGSILHCKGRTVIHCFEFVCEESPWHQSRCLNGDNQAFYLNQHLTWRQLRPDCPARRWLLALKKLNSVTTIAMVPASIRVWGRCPRAKTMAGVIALHYVKSRARQGRSRYDTRVGQTPFGARGWCLCTW